MSQVAKPALWKSIKEKWHRGSRGGKAGQWNARKAQLAVQEYKRRGGKYKTRRFKNNSLAKWTKEDWGYVDGKKGNRYLPAAVRKRLSPAEKRATNRLKKQATRRKKQYASWGRAITQKFKKYVSKPRITRKRGGGARARRLANGTITFNDYPEFRPNLTPREMFKLGSFGGTYWRPIYSAVNKRHYKNQHKEFPKSWWSGISESKLSSIQCDKGRNKYSVNSGTSLKYWESKKWIKKQDPYGWVQWYCRFYLGRRTPDDTRQIRRWLAFAGPKGRFRLRLINLIKKKRTTLVSPVIRQGLQHWAFHI